MEGVLFHSNVEVRDADPHRRAPLKEDVAYKDWFWGELAALAVAVEDFVHSNMLDWLPVA